MKVNEKIAGLPKWPAIYYDREKDHFAVEAAHVSYGRFTCMKWVIGIALLLLFIFPGVVKLPDEFLGAYYFSFGSLAVLCAALPSARILCRVAFPQKTKILFTPKEIIIGPKSFDITKVANVQFQAERPALSEDKFSLVQKNAQQQNATLYTSYPLKFRRLEMIYGLELVHITTVADRYRAQQFAIVLQEALRLVRSPQRKTIQ